MFFFYVMIFCYEASGRKCASVTDQLSIAVWLKAFAAVIIGPLTRVATNLDYVMWFPHKANPQNKNLSFKALWAKHKYTEAKNRFPNTRLCNGLKLCCGREPLKLTVQTKTTFWIYLQVLKNYLRKLRRKWNIYCLVWDLLASYY